MGQAMAAAVIKNHLAKPQDVSISDVSQPILDSRKQELGVFTSTNNLEVAGRGEISPLDQASNAGRRNGRVEREA